MTGIVLYLSGDRFDLMYPARPLAADLVSPTNQSWWRLKRLVKYLLGTVTLALLYPYQNEKEASRYSAYGDSDWAGDKVTRKSISSGIIFRGKHPLEFWCTGQQLVSLSSGESEFYAAGTAAAYLLFMVYLVREMKMKAQGYLYGDSSAARGIVGRVGPGRLRHLQTRFLWLQERLRQKEFILGSVPGESNPGDLGSKIMSYEKMWELFAFCGMALSNHNKKLNKKVAAKGVTVITALNLLMVAKAEDVDAVAVDSTNDYSMLYALGIMFVLLQVMLMTLAYKLGFANGEKKKRFWTPTSGQATPSRPPPSAPPAAPIARELNYGTAVTRVVPVNCAYRCGMCL